jgi:hypothetical protein
MKGKARIVRRKEVIHDGILQTLRRYQDEVARSGRAWSAVSGSRASRNSSRATSSRAYTVEKVAQQL